MKDIKDLIKRKNNMGSVGALDFLINWHSKKNNKLSNNVQHAAGIVITQENNASGRYSLIYRLSAEISKKKSSEEFDYLLEFANEIRKIEMSETYLRLIKYLLVQFCRLNADNQINMLLHLSNVLRLARDEELILMLLNHHFDLIPKLRLSPKIFDEIFGSCLSKSYDYAKDKLRYFAFDLHSEPELAATFLYADESFKVLEESPEKYCLLCNLYAKKNTELGNERYRLFFNKFLELKRLPNVKSINLDLRNVLASLEFELLPKIKKGPLVSIIMSAFQAQETIEYAVGSLLKQTYENIELLICDDDSSDNTQKILEALAKIDRRVKVFRSKNNQGTYNIRNDLLKYATGQYITFQDSDDFALPNRIEMQVNALQNSNAIICTSQWIRIAPSGEFVFFHDDKLSRFCVVSSMVEKSLFDVVGPFRRSLVAADTEFYERVCCIYGEDRMYKIELPLILGFWGEGSLTKTPNLSAENNGYVAPRRRSYSDLAARQRVLGKKIIYDQDIEEILKLSHIYKSHHGIQRLNEEGWV